jgi:TRAP-type C4-dicarboxylate transport system permease small subunit
MKKLERNAPNRKLIVKAVIVALGSLACILLGLQGWSMAYIDWSSQNVLDVSHLLPTVLIPTFLLIVGILSVVSFIRGVREGNKRQS